MKPSFLLFFWLYILATGPGLMAQSPLLQMEISTVHGQPYSLSLVKEQPLSVFFFLAPECPLCENYALSIKNLRKQFASKEVSFYGVFAGETYTAAEITHYMARFQLPVKALKDSDYTLTEHFGASVTPEVFVVNAQGSVLYQGKIDNWIAALGKKRLQATRFYLKDALEASLQGCAVPLSQTEAVGCLIE